MDRRLWLSLFVTLTAIGTGRAQSVSLAESPLTDQHFRIETTMRFQGTIKVQNDDKLVTHKQTATAEHAYLERVLEAGQHGIGNRAARWYEKAKARIVFDDQPDDDSDRALRLPDRALMIADRLPEQVLTYCPKGLLTRPEVELTEHFDSLALSGLVPGKDLAVGATWKLSSAAAQALCDLDGLIKHDLTGKLDKVDGTVAHLSVTGEAQGIDLGATVKMSVRATARFDLKARRVVALQWKQSEEREAGPINPAIQAEVAIQVQRMPIEPSQRLSDIALVIAPSKNELKARDEHARVTYRHPENRYHLVHARDWLTTYDRGHLVLRLMHRGDFVAQVTIVPWRKALPGRHLEPEKFVADMGQTPGWKQERIVEQRELASAHKGHWVYRLVASGQLDGVETVTYFYLVAGPQGDQTVLTFTMTPAQAQKLGERDLALVRGLTYPEPEITPAGDKAP